MPPCCILFFKRLDRLTGQDIPVPSPRAKERKIQPSGKVEWVHEVDCKNLVPCVVVVIEVLVVRLARCGEICKGDVPDEGAQLFVAAQGRGWVLAVPKVRRRCSMISMSASL